MKNGFRLDEIHGMTLDQITLYTQEATKLNASELAGQVRAVAWGSRAEQKDMNKFLKTLEQQ